MADLSALYCDVGTAHLKRSKRKYIGCKVLWSIPAHNTAFARINVFCHTARFVFIVSVNFSALFLAICAVVMYYH